MEQNNKAFEVEEQPEDWSSDEWEHYLAMHAQWVAQSLLDDASAELTISVDDCLSDIEILDNGTGLWYLYEGSKDT
jgi:hypothetical protein